MVIGLAGHPGDKKIDAEFYLKKGRIFHGEILCSLKFGYYIGTEIIFGIQKI